MDTNTFLALLKKKLDSVDADKLVEMVNNLTRLPQEASWTTTEGQQVFTITEGEFTDELLMVVTASGVPQSGFTKLDDKSFQLAEPMPAEETVTVSWTTANKVVNQTVNVDDIINTLDTTVKSMNEIMYNVKAFPYLAIGDGNSHPLSERFSTLAQAQATFPKATSLTEEIDYHAIRKCLDDKGHAYCPAGKFITTKRLDVVNASLVGRSRRLTEIINMNGDEAILGVAGLVYVADLTIHHWGLPKTQVVPAGAGINNIGGVNDGSVFERLHIYNVTSGILREDANTDYIYSTTFRDMRISRFTHSAIYIGGSGHTGNVFQNIYAVNWDNYDLKTKLSAKYGFYIQGNAEGFASQLNVEHGHFNFGLLFNDCENFELNSVHFEGHNPKDNYGALFSVINSQIRINGATIVFSTFDAANIANYSLMSISGKSSVLFRGFTSRDNTKVGNVSLNRFFGSGTVNTASSIKAEQFDMRDNLFNNGDYFGVTADIPILKQYNDTIYYQSEGGKRVDYGTAAPSNGAWTVGDRRINTNPANPKNITQWVCISAGTFGTATIPYFMAEGTGQFTTAQRTGMTLTGNDRGYKGFDTDLNAFLYWNGGSWKNTATGATV